MGATMTTTHTLEAPHDGAWQVVELREGHTEFGECRAIVTVEVETMNYDMRTNTSKPVMGTKVYGVMRIDSESVMTDLKRSNEHLIESARVSRDEMRKAIDEVGNLNTKVEDLAGKLTKAVESTKSWQARVENERIRANKLESDIAKLRTALGDIRMNEILKED
jgi:hypothetical protein